MLAQYPVTTTLAIIGWLGAGLYCVRPGFRQWLDKRLRMPTPSTHSPLQTVDALRGLAALWVATFHFWQWTTPYFEASRRAVPIISGGERAVPLFVILSGFLIWRSIRVIRTRDDLVRYAGNRFLRLYPLYAAVTLVLFVAGQTDPGVNRLRGLASDLLMARAFGSPLFLAPHAWSLYVEVIFYLAAPVIAAAFGKRALP